MDGFPSSLPSLLIGVVTLRRFSRFLTRMDDATSCR
jgi:hypothetical protein